MFFRDISRDKNSMLFVRTVFSSFTVVRNRRESSRFGIIESDFFSVSVKSREFPFSTLAFGSRAVLKTSPVTNYFKDFSGLSTTFNNVSAMANFFFRPLNRVAQTERRLVVYSNHRLEHRESPIQASRLAVRQTFASVGRLHVTFVTFFFW